jgi:Xaa-Pro aminopeptidase
MASAQERERRYAALRAAMAQAGLEALIVCARGDEFQRGRLQYVSDLFMWAGRGYLVLPLVHPPILFQSRSIAWAEAAGWVQDNRSAVEPPRAIAEALADLGLGRARLGLVGLADVIAVGDLQLLEQGLPAAHLEDATMLFDAVRAIKSAEEIDYLRETSEVLKRAYTAMEAVLRPGISERQVIAEGHRVARLLGCLDGIAHLGRTTGLRMIRPPNESIVAREDVVTFDLEFAGPHGYWLELSRQYSFGPPPEAAKRLHAVQAEVYERCVEQMKPGVASRDILATADAAYRRHGYSAAGPVGYHAHGIGLDSLEPPWVPGIDMTLEAGMVISLHPHIAPHDAGLPSISIEDNILMMPAGGERLTDPVNRWIEL